MLLSILGADGRRAGQYDTKKKISREKHPRETPRPADHNMDSHTDRDATERREDGIALTGQSLSIILLEGLSTIVTCEASLVYPFV